MTSPAPHAQLASRPTDGNASASTVTRAATALAAIGQAMATARDQSRMLAAVIEQACQAIEASRGGFMRYDEERDELVLQAPAFGVQAEHVVSRYRVSLAAGGNAAQVFQSRVASIANDAQHDPRFIQRFVRLFDTRNTLTVALVLNDRTLGIFHAINKRHGDFTDADRDLLVMLAPLLAACLQLVLLERGLSGQQRQLARQQQLHERLLDTAYGAGGLEELCAALHAVLQRPLLLLDNLRRPLASLAWPSDPIQVAHGLEAHALRDGRAVTLALPGRAPLRATAIAIALQSNRAGTLLIAHHDKPLDDVETRAAEQAASLLAVEFLQQRSLAATANQVANAVLLSLFGEGLSSADAQRLLVRLGVTPRGPWRVLVLELRGPLATDDAPALTNGPLLREALERSLGALRGRVRLLHWRDDLVVIADEASAERFNDRALLRRLQQTLDAVDGVAQPLRLRIGIGRAEADPALLAVSLKTADQALRALARLPRKSTTLKFEDLGVYRLLLGGNLAHDHDEFARQALAPILRGKGRQALLTTLSALVAHNFNLAAVARQLGVHQNTIKYRMRQLREAFGRDPSRGDLRLEIELALKIRLLQ